MPVSTDLTKLCQSDCTSKDGLCEQPAMANGRCKKHGGLTPAGADSPHFKHGGRTRHMPKRIAELAAEADNDTELLNIRADIVLLETRIRELFATLGDKHSGELWDATKKAYDLLQKAKRSGKQSQIDEAEFQLNATITAGYNDSQAWRELRALAQEKAVLSKEERLRLKETQQTMTYQQANTLLAAVAAAVHRWVSDKEERAGLSAAIYALMTAER